MVYGSKVELDGLSEKECIQLAYNKILKSASICEQSSIKMRQKLSLSGFPEEITERALNKAIEFGIIDDARYANILIRSTLASGKGLSKAKYEIQKLGIDIDSLEAYQEYCEISDEDLTDRALEYLRSHPTRSKNVYGSAVRKLLNRGYSNDIANKAARIYSQS